MSCGLMSCGTFLCHITQTEIGLSDGAAQRRALLLDEIRAIRSQSV